MKTKNTLIRGSIASLAMWMLAASPLHAQDLSPEAGTGAGLGAFMILVIASLWTLGFAGFTLIWRGLFPRKVEWTGEIGRRMPWGSLVFGFVVSLFLLIIVAWLGSLGNDIAGLVAMILLGAYLVIVVSFGKAAIIEWAGELIDPASSGIRRAILGAAGLVLMLLIPILGWLVLAGLAFVGIGASLMSYVPPRQVAAEAAPEAEGASE
jgi:hypothetical protein